MDQKERDLRDRLTRLTLEHETLGSELKELLPPASNSRGGGDSGALALSGKDLAKRNWIESRLREIEASRRQLTQRLNELEQHRSAEH